MRDYPLGHPKNAESPENLAETAARNAEIAKAEGHDGKHAGGLLQELPSASGDTATSGGETTGSERDGAAKQD